MKLENYYENPFVVRLGMMENRAYYIPQSPNLKREFSEREQSDRFQLLSGEWKFKYYSNIESVNDAFIEEDFNSEDFDILPVPSNWQNYGYDHHQYTNVRLAIPYDPPYVPVNNPCGAYITEFTVSAEKQTLRKYINFEGVDAAYYLWVNSTFIGYNQVSHCTGEFDITDHVKEVTNSYKKVIKVCDSILKLYN